WYRLGHFNTKSGWHRFGYLNTEYWYRYNYPAGCCVGNRCSRLYCYHRYRLGYCDGRNRYWIGYLNAKHESGNRNGRNWYWLGYFNTRYGWHRFGYLNTEHRPESSHGDSRDGNRCRCWRRNDCDNRRYDR